MTTAVPEDDFIWGWDVSSDAYIGYGEGWITSSADPRLVVFWPGAADYQWSESASDALAFPLYCAMVQCREFAPALAEGALIPENWIAAQVLQTRALVRAGLAGDGDRVGLTGESVAVFPMDWQVKSLLRPRRGKPILR